MTVVERTTEAWPALPLEEWRPTGSRQSAPLPTAHSADLTRVPGGRLGPGRRPTRPGLGVRRCGIWFGRDGDPEAVAAESILADARAAIRRERSCSPYLVAPARRTARAVSWLTPNSAARSRRLWLPVFARIAASWAGESFRRGAL